MIFEIHVVTEGRETYHVDAPSEEAARKLFNEGNVPRPTTSEMTGASIESINEPKE